MTPPLAFGLTLPNRGVMLGLTTPAQLLELADRAEDSGVFDSVWVGDSLFAKPYYSMDYTRARIGRVPVAVEK